MNDCYPTSVANMDNLTEKEQLVDACRAALSALEWAYGQLKNSRSAMFHWREWCEDEVCPSIELLKEAIARRR